MSFMYIAADLFGSVDTERLRINVRREGGYFNFEGPGGIHGGTYNI
jgi:hypothetical protein